MTIKQTSWYQRRILPFVVAVFVTSLCDGETSQDIDIDKIAEQMIASRKIELDQIYGSNPISWKATRGSNQDILILTWGGSSSPVIVLRNDAKKQLIWGEKKVVVNSGQQRYTPMLCIDTTGGCFIAWKQIAPDGFFVRRVSGSGETLWEHMMTNNDVLHYSLLPLKDDNLLLSASNMRETFVASISSDGKRKWNEKITVLETSDPNHKPISSCLFDDKSALIAWVSHNENGNIYVAQRVELQSGKMLWLENKTLGKSPDCYLRIPPPPTLIRAQNSITAILLKGVLGDVEDTAKEYRATITPDGIVTITNTDKE